MSHQRRFYDDDAIWAGEQERQKVKTRKKVKKTLGVTSSPIRGHAPAERTKINWSRRRRNHVFQILAKSVKGFPSCDGPKMGVFY